MPEPKGTLKSPVFYAMLVLWLVLLLGGISFFMQYQELNVWSLTHETNENTGQEVTPRKDYFGGNDWVRWADSSKGVVAVEVHPLLGSHPEWKEKYIREGDMLRSVDYYPVYKADAVEDIVFRSAPGKFFIYQVERINPYSFTPERVNVWVGAGFKPQMAFSDYGVLWTAFFWVNAIGALLSLISILILFPILRGPKRERFSLFLVLIGSIMLFITQLIRHIYFLVESDFSTLGAEKAFLIGILFWMGFYATSYLHSRLEKGLRWMVIFPGVLSALFLFAAVKALYSGYFGIWSDLVVEGAMFYFITHVLAVLVISVLTDWNLKSLQDRFFHVIAILVSLGIMGIYAGGLFNWQWLPAPSEPTLFLGMLCFFIPLANSAVSQLKFGKVSVVLTRTLLYILLATGVFILYLLIRAALNAFGVKFVYQNLLEISLLILACIILVGLYRNFSDRFQKYFILIQQKKRQQLERFIALIPQQSSSYQLIEALREELIAYFETDRTDLWLNEEQVPDSLAEFTEEELFTIKDKLRGQENFWTLNKQLNPAALFPFESRLQSSGLHLVYLLDVNEKQTGLLVMGKKKRGVYNLADLEIISRIIQQVRLTLSVLQLLEREKLLLQKNYEANLTALRSQINPHFLFNTLNTISSLIHDAPDDAEEAVEKLAFIFRYTLKTSSRNFVTLKEELSLVRTYLDIEKLRFGERLKVVYDIDEDMEDVTLPALIVQTLVENCIKHGVAKIIEQGVISIKAYEIDKYMVCEVKDNGPGIDHSKIKTSTGLTNSLTRLEEIYQIKNLLYFENTGHGTLVTLKIPLRHHE